MKRIARENVREVLKANGNRLFCALFTKKDGTDRKMVARLGVRKNLRGGENRVAKLDNSYVTVFDMHADGYRTLNLRTLKKIKISGKEYEVI